jgi:hypothetical protein
MHNTNGSGWTRWFLELRRSARVKPSPESDHGDSDAACVDDILQQYHVATLVMHQFHLGINSCEQVSRLLSSKKWSLYLDPGRLLGTYKWGLVQEVHEKLDILRNSNEKRLQICVACARRLLKHVYTLLKSSHNIMLPIPQAAFTRRRRSQAKLLSLILRNLSLTLGSTLQVPYESLHGWPNQLTFLVK